MNRKQTSSALCPILFWTMNRYICTFFTNCVCMHFKLKWVNIYSSTCTCFLEEVEKFQNDTDLSLWICNTVLRFDKFNPNLFKGSQLLLECMQWVAEQNPRLELPLTIQVKTSNFLKYFLHLRYRHHRWT